MTAGAQDNHAKADKATRIAGLSIAVAIVVMGIKYVAYVVSGSVALYSDAAESIVNVMTAMAALLAIHIGSKPADKNHPFGHHKAEFFAAIFEGAMIIVAAIMIMSKAYSALKQGVVLESPGLGIVINAGATVINAAWASLLINRGKSLRSPDCRQTAGTLPPTLQPRSVSLLGWCSQF